MLTAAAATSTGGLAAFTVKHFFQPDRNHQTNEPRERENENRDNETRNRAERNESFQGRIRG
jgi:hypothetical protein